MMVSPQSKKKMLALGVDLTKLAPSAADEDSWSRSQYTVVP